MKMATTNSVPLDVSTSDPQREPEDFRSDFPQDQDSIHSNACYPTQSEKGLNVLIVTPFPTDTCGGVSTAVFELKREFSKPPNTATILAPSSSHRLTSCGDPDVYGMYLRDIAIKCAPFKGFVAFVVFFPVTLLRLWQFLRRRRIDVIHIQYPVPNMIYFAVLRPLGRWNLVVTFQGNDAHDLHTRNWLGRWFIERIILASDHVTGVSDSLIEKVRGQFPRIKIQTSVVPNGAHVTKASVTQSSAVNCELWGSFVLTVGHLILRKGIDTLIEALAILKREGRQMRVVAIGDGADRERFEKQAAIAGVADQLYFVGWKTHNEVVCYMLSCQFFVLASREEGLPLVIAEAMLLGKTVVATNVDGVPQIVVDRVTGLLVPPDNPLALAKAMDVMYRDETLRGALENAAYAHATREFTWNVIAFRYIELFKKCLGKHNAISMAQNRESEWRDDRN